MGLKARRAAIGIGIFSDPVISNDYVKLLSLDYPSSGRGCIVNPVNSRCIDSSIRIENAHACTHRDFTYLSRALVALFDRGRSQNDYNNYFIRRGSGPLCLPILKVITRCLHTALRELLFGAPFCLGHDTRSAEPAAPWISTLCVYASACPPCKLTLSRYSSFSYNALSWMCPCASLRCSTADIITIMQDTFVQRDQGRIVLKP